VLDDGAVVELADPAMRTPHAGACLMGGANSRFYGISVATNGLVPATAPQISAIIAVCVAVFKYHRWGAADCADRIVGHDGMAVWTPDATRTAGLTDAKGCSLWGKLGRKVDPTGVRRDGRPILDTQGIRRAVSAALQHEGGSDERE
jgi:hypothetical protein